MYKVSINSEKNRIYIQLGHSDPGEDEKISDEIMSAMRQLHEGFTCITDIREYKPSSLDETLKIAKMQRIMVKAGMAKAARVVNPADNQPLWALEETSKSLGYETYAVYTLEEAEALLNK